MAQVDFSYNGSHLTIQCNKYDKMGEIFQKFFIKSGLTQNSVYFIYSENSNINRELTFEEIANIDDKIRSKMNILVMDNTMSTNKYYSNNLIINNISQNYGKPLIFETLSDLNKRFDKLENEIKEKSKNMRRRIDEMKSRLMKVEKKRIRYSDATYYGQTIDKEVTGLGIIENDNGDKYEGEMLDDNKSGIGIFYELNGTIFMGEFKQDKRNGFGIEDNSRVGKYEGSWLDDCLTGTGIVTYKDGNIYIGQMDNAQFSGFGKLLFINGDYFIGEFKDGNRVKGKAFYSDEQAIFDSTWDEREEKTIAKGIFYLPDGTKENRIRIITDREAHWEYY